jgi:hypothetical protein
VSGAITAHGLQRRAATLDVTTTQSQRDLLTSGIDAALARLTSSRYGRSESLDGTGLDDAMDAVTRAAGRVASRHTWWAELLRSAGTRLRRWRSRAWTR